MYNTIYLLCQRGAHLKEHSIGHLTSFFKASNQEIEIIKIECIQIESIR